MMDNKSDEHFIIMPYAIEANNQEMKSNKQDSDEKKDEAHRILQINAHIIHHINDGSY